MSVKKVISLILIVVLMTVIVSCSEKGGNVSSGVDPNAPHITLALRSGVYSDAIKSCIYAFEEENQVICDVLELGEDELHSNILEDAANEKGKYDLCMVDGSWKAEMVAKDVLLDLSDEGYELDDDIIEATKTICYKGDDLYLAPYYGNVTVLLFNKRLVEETGYTVERLTSLQDLYNVCTSTSEKGNLGFMYRGDSPNNYVVDFLPILRAYGGWVVDENNNPTVNTVEFKEALAFYKVIISTGKAEKRDNLIIAIANGAAAMAIGWPGWYTPTAKSSSDYVAIRGRLTNGAAEYNANVYGIWTVGIPKNTKNKELSMKLLKYLMDPEVQKGTIEYGGVPCRYSSLTDEKILAENPAFKAVFKALENGIYRPDMEEWPEFYTILGEEMKEILENDKDISEGLQEAQEKLEEMLGK